MIKLLTQLAKNYIIIFRNWTSFLILIVGPLFLMALLGIIFSSSSLAGVTIGFTGNTELIPFYADLDSAFEITEYDSRFDCVQDIKLGQIAACVQIVNGIPPKIFLIVDNSRYTLSNILTVYFTQRLGLSSEQIVEKTTSELITQVGSFELFITQSQKQLGGFEQNISTWITNLDTFQQEISETSTALDAAVLELESIEQVLSQSNFDSGDLAEADKKIEDTLDDINQIQSDIDAYKQVVDPTENDVIRAFELLELYAQEDSEAALIYSQLDVDQVLETVSISNIEEIEQSIDQAETDLRDVQNSIDDYKNVGDIDENKAKFSQIITESKQLSFFLKNIDSQIGMTIVQFSEVRANLQQMNTAMDSTKAQIQDLVGINASNVAKPFDVENQALSKDKSQVYLLFPILLSIIIIFISIFFANIIMLNEIYSLQQLRGFVLPVSDFSVLFSYYITNLSLVFFQILVLSSIAQIWFGIPIFAHFFAVFFISGLLSTFFILLGMIVAYSTRSKENSILISTFTAVSFFFFADMLLPSEMMPTLVSTLINFNPIVQASQMLRSVLLYGESLLNFIPSISLLLFYIVVLFSILLSVMHHYRMKFK